MRNLIPAVPLIVGVALGATPPSNADSPSNLHRGGIQHVLLISIDGMHSVDFINCANGIAGVNGGAPYCPHLAELRSDGVNYLDATTSKPSDSFPGLMAIVAGGSLRMVGAFYDVAYDRSLDLPCPIGDQVVYSEMEKGRPVRNRPFE